MQSRDTRDFGFSVAVTLVALAPRIFVALTWAHEPVWDGHYYHFGAERIAAGLGYSEDVVVDGISRWKPWSHYPVGYSGFLAAAYAVIGAKTWVAPMLNAIVGALTVLTTHRLARCYMSQRRSQIAATLVALHPGLIAYTALVMTEALAAWLILLAIYARARLREGMLRILIPGVIIGLGALVRPACLLTAPLLMLTEPKLWRALTTGLALSVIALVTVLPWTLRNCTRMDGCALISTNGGWNLAIGALSETGRFKSLRAADGCPVVTGQVQQDRCWGAVGKRVIAENPAAWLKLVPKKLSQTFDHESFAVEYLREADPRSWPEGRREAARLLLSTFHRALLVLAAFAALAFVPWRRTTLPAAVTQSAALAATLAVSLYAALSPETPFYLLLLPLALFSVAPLPGRPHQGPLERVCIGLVLSTALVHAVFFGDDRYHIAIVPALCLLAAAAFRRPGQMTQPTEALTLTLDSTPPPGWTRLKMTSTIPDMTPEFRIRGIEPRDNAGIADVIRRVMPEFGAGGPGFAINDPEVDFMHAAYTRPKAAYFVVVDAQDWVLGGGGIAPLDGGPADVCELKKMYFLSELRGRGMGKALLTRCLGAAQEFGFRLVYLETLTGMDAAQHLYRNAGFRPRRAPLGATGHHGCDRYYELDLSSA